MKKVSFILVAVIFLSACNRPVKLLEKGKSKKALKSSMNRLKSGKVKDQNLYVFEKAFLLETEKDAQLVASLKRKGDPALWLDIHKTAKNMVKRQSKVEKVLNRINNKGHHPRLDFYPAKELLEEATDNVALYYYAKAQEFIPAAHSNDRQAARVAYKWLRKSQEYRANFKDSRLLANEMYDIGTTHILLNPIDGFNSKDDRLFSSFFGRQSFPERKNWEVFHLAPPSGEDLDYRVDMSWDKVYVSWDDVDQSFCSNTVSVQDGCEQVQVWSAKDSTFVTENRPVYIDVSVTVNTFYQNKYAELRMNCNVYNLATRQRENYFDINHQENWSNEYSRVLGDDRALSGTCGNAGGSKACFPSDWTLLRSASYDIYRKFDCVIDREIRDL